MAAVVAIKLTEEHEVWPGVKLGAGIVLRVDPRTASEYIRNEWAVPAEASECAMRAPSATAVRPQPRGRTVGGNGDLRRTGSRWR
jgi:hypothetical protein